jgi:amino acid permease
MTPDGDPFCFESCKQKSLRVLPDLEGFFSARQKRALSIYGAWMKKSLSIIMLAIIGLIVIYGTVCLFMGDFTGAYATFPFLIVYYVWVLSIKRRKSREQSDEHDPGASGQGG